MSRPLKTCILVLLPFMALVLVAPVGALTKLRLHATASSIAGYKEMTLSLGAGTANLVTNTSAGGTDIQVTNTGGGTAQAWISEALVSGFTLAGTVTCNVYGGQSANTANTALRCRLYKYSGGAEGAALLTANMTTELTTSLTTVRTWTGTPTSTAFAAGDRLVLKLFLENCATSGCPTGTMAAGQTVTLHYDGLTDAVDGSSWVQTTETLSFPADITTGLVGRWALNDGTGSSTAADSSGSGLTGTLTNMDVNADWVTGAPGLGGGLNFDGTDGYVDAGTSATLNPVAVTVAAWVKAETFDTYTAVFSRVSTGGAAFYQLLVKSDGKLALYVQAAGVVSYDGTGTFTLTTGTWFHVALTYSSTAGLAGYVNGAPDGTASANGALTTASAVASIGTDTETVGREFDGVIDEVRVYNRVLSATDIAGLYTFTEATAAPVRRRVLAY